MDDPRLPSPPPVCHVYILRNQTAGRLYTGASTDLRRRLCDHTCGNTPTTRGKGPWDLVYVEAWPDRRAALRRERHLKSLEGGPEKFRLVAEASEEQRAEWRHAFAAFEGR